MYMHVHVTRVLTFFIMWVRFHNAAGTRKRSGCGNCQGCGYRATGLWHLHQLGNCVLKSLILYSSIKDTLSPLICVQLGIHE